MHDNYIQEHGELKKNKKKLPNNTTLIKSHVNFIKLSLLWLIYIDGDKFNSRLKNFESRQIKCNAYIILIQKCKIYITSNYFIIYNAFFFFLIKNFLN